MPVNAVAENVLGTIGTICWTVQLLPQIYKSHRLKSTEGLSDWLVLLWGIAAAFLGTYNVIQDLNIPLIVQPQIFGTLSFISWGQCQFYGRKRSLQLSFLYFLLIMAIAAAFETGMVFAVRPPYQSGNGSAKSAVQFFGIFTSVLLAVGLLPQYYEIWKYKVVLGISVLFMIVDAMGGLFSVLSLVFKPKFDVVAGVAYSVVFVMDCLIVLAALILNPRTGRPNPEVIERRV
ncbi:hypothetical protein K435DRAFT_370325 [Dendrothele bispora CBS 962.96]|uniref:PQ-loop-domain-containing protein n=1 Tax=Dendrothele bispora (strain CBS 962.96) TaxID=1314807 RepID=A0A4S8LD17_DENBC|nr:hypothetical protein K435DRAFT_370325 [Dendrothele bispora CBS 962.96]